MQANQTDVAFDYDGALSLARRLYALAEEVEQATRSRQARIVEARTSDGRMARYAYEDGHLVGVQRPSGAVTYGLSGGRVASVVDTDGVVVVRNEYGEVGRVIVQDSPFGRRSLHSYGDAGVTVVTDTDGSARATPSCTIAGGT